MNRNTKNITYILKGICIIFIVINMKNYLFLLENVYFRLIP